MSEVSATDAFAYAPNGKPVYKAEPPVARPVSRPYAFWSTGYVSFGSADQTAQRSAIDFNTTGVSAGVDYRFGRTFIGGFGFGYGRDTTKIGDRGTRSDAEAYNVAAYGSYRPFKNVFIDGLAGYGAMRFNSQRYIVDDAAFAYGSRNGSQFFAALTAAYQFHWQAMMLSPYARIKATWITLDAFTETGGLGGALTYGTQSLDLYTAVLGLRGKYTFLTDWGSVVPRFRVEYNHDFAGSSTVLLQYADLVGPIYSLTTSPLSRDRATFGAGTDLVIGNRHRLAFDYQYDVDLLGADWHRFKVRWESRF
jgi:outer membrane autotransporter protein